MKSPKSLVAVMLLVVVSLFSCKHNNEENVLKGDKLVVSIGGFNVPGTTVKTLQITESASYIVTYTSGNPTIVTLPVNIHNNLKQYLGSFPRAAIKADPKKGSYSLRGAADDSFETFAYIQISPADTTQFDIDSHSSTLPVSYIDSFLKNINKTIADNKLLDL